MTISSSLLPLLLIVNTAVIRSAWSFALTPSKSSRTTELQQRQGRHDQYHFSSRSFYTSAISLPQQDVSPRKMSTHLQVASADVEADLDMPELGNDGIHHIMDERQYKALLETHKDKLIILKVFAPWCKACKGLEPKFNAIVRDKKYDNLPIVWADLTIQNNKDFVKSIGVLALPTIQFYARSQVLDTFPCGPSKVPILKRKLVQLINDQVDPTTYQLKEMSADASVVVQDKETDDAMIKNGMAMMDATTSVSQQDLATRPSALPSDIQKKDVTTAPLSRDKEEEESVERIIQRHKSMLRSNRYLSELLESEFETLLTKANLLTFESGSLIMKEGNPGRAFYIMLDGEVEICQHTSFEDPLTTPSQYLGTVVALQDRKGDYFGERSLITGEPRAASIRAVSRTQCLVFDKDDFPRTSVLSGQASLVDERSKEEVINEVNDKYGVALTDVSQLNGQKQYQDSVAASQVRGSVNNPRVIDGVDNDKEIEDVAAKKAKASKAQKVETTTGEDDSPSLGVETAMIVPLLMRFKLIRCITRCFDYIVQNRLTFGDTATLRRRKILANMLSPTQLQSIKDAFRLVDEDGDGEITLMELRRIMDSIGEERSDKELLDLIETSHFSAMDGKKVITEEAFTGLMAEVEIYYLFLDTFTVLDPQNTGFVRAKDLDRVLCGVRDLISDDRHSIIDVVDKEMMVDYEQFSRMLLGLSLKV
ncbi:cyclic nucleotide-binding protein [Nitzschia inconspicua]|uniref:Cyclic nucleotide-binding protein n=1 Tax=Nitzschia inconspicua TaxID=303405 RepID=A0A9K3PP41_9STRA|nr:cyclic nucleotide-binding protein [Nitzschia inconspicua]